VKKRSKLAILHKEEFSVSVSVSPTTSSQLGGHITRLSMVNQDTTLRLPMFHGMGKR
jgi:hypothetical protein